MFRWLKDRKKQKGSRKKTDDEYGFRSYNGSDSSDYGFNDRFHGQFHPGFKDIKPLDDAAYHIYEEILDLPNALDSPNSDANRTHTSQSQSLAKQIVEGPYMVVPIVLNDYSSDVSREYAGGNAQEKCDACGEFSSCARLCNCEHSRVLNEGNYSPPWDSSDEASVLSRLPKSNDCEDFKHFQNFVTKNRHSEAADAYLSSDKSDSSRSSRSSYSSRSFSQSSRSNSETDYNDTCCEYDMSTSGESDISEGGTYKMCLEKVQQNLLLKHQVRNIIKTLSTTEDSIGEESSTITTDAESISSRSRPSSAPNVNNLFDPEVFIEKSESDDSSGYYECSDDLPQGRENIKPRLQHTKHRSHLKKLKNYPEKSQSCGGAIQEDTEMYLLPTTKKDSEYNTSKMQRKPLLPPKSAAIYHDPSRSKNGSNNRLLSDLIRMNYEKQHMVRV